MELHPMDTTANVTDRNTIEQVDKDSAVRNAMKVAHDTLVEHVPEGRYKSLAITSFEIAAMWAIKGIFHTKDTKNTK